MLHTHREKKFTVQGGVKMMISSYSFLLLRVVSFLKLVLLDKSRLNLQIGEIMAVVSQALSITIFF